MGEGVRVQLVGQQLGAYQVLQEIGRGGQGAVLKARHVQLGTEVALKLLLEPEPRAVQRFQQEAQILARLSHPNLPRVTDLGEVSGRPYLAMEFVAGRDLKAHVREHGLPSAAWTVEVLRAISGALQYCHEQGLVHRDLKPANVLIEEEGGRPVLVDFGLVKRDPEQFAVPAGGAGLSVEGEIKGTPAFMAPEQADPEFGAVGPRTDVYALGGTLFFLLTGKPPYEGTTGYNVLARLMRDEAAPDPRGVVPGAHVGLAALCRRALAKRPDDRPPSAEAFAGELTRALRAPRQRVQLALGIGVALLLGLGVGGAFGLASSERVDPWEAAKLKLAGGEALRAEEMEALAQVSAAREWIQHVRVENALRLGEGPGEADLESLPAGPAAELLRARALLARLEEEGAAADLMEHTAAGASASLPWEAPSPRARWADVAEQLEGGGHAEAAQAWVWVAYHSGDGSELDVWLGRAFDVDPLSAASSQAPIGEVLLESAHALLASSRAPTIEEVARGRQRLEWFRLLRPFEAIPPATLDELHRLGTGEDMGVRRVALPHRDDWPSKYKERLGADALLRTPLTAHQLERMIAWEIQSWPGDWGHVFFVMRGHMGRPRKQDRMVSSWLLWRPEHPGLWLQRSTFLREVNRPRLAEYAARISLRAARKGYSGHHEAIARALEQQRRYQEAIPAFMETLRCYEEEGRPPSANVTNLYARTLIHAGGKENAVTALAILDEVKDPRRLAVHVHWRLKANAYAALGDEFRQRQCLDRAAKARRGTESIPPKW